MEWISVTDRLPELYDFVLVYANNTGTNEPKPISIARIVNTIGTWDFLGMCEVGGYMDIEYDISSDEITHWMPLPQPPVECKIALCNHDFPISNKSTEFPNG